MVEKVKLKKEKAKKAGKVENFLWKLSGVGLVLIPVGIVMWIWFGNVGWKTSLSGIVVWFSCAFFANLVQEVKKEYTK